VACILIDNLLLLSLSLSLDWPCLLDVFKSELDFFSLNEQLQELDCQERRWHEGLGTLMNLSLCNWEAIINKGYDYKLCLSSPILEKWLMEYFERNCRNKECTYSSKILTVFWLTSLIIGLILPGLT